MASFPETFASLELPGIARAVRHEVFEFMAWVAERDTVLDIEAQRREIGERLDVMRAKIAAFVIAAFRAGKAVSFKNRLSPYPVFRTAAVILVPFLCTILPRVVVGTTRRPFSRKSTYSGFGFWGVFGANSAFIPAMGCRHHCAGFGRVGSAFEGTWTAFCAHPFFYSPAGLAFGTQTIMPAGIPAVTGSFFPHPARPTPLLAAVNSAQEFLKRYTRFCRDTFCRSDFRLSHNY